MIPGLSENIQCHEETTLSSVANQQITQTSQRAVCLLIANGHFDPNTVFLYAHRGKHAHVPSHPLSATHPLPNLTSL